MFAAILFGSGCNLSPKWALDDADYAKKYNRQFDDHGLEQRARVVKQSVDARFAKDKAGFYAEAGGGTSPAAAGGTIGVLAYPQSFASARLGISGLLHESGEGGLVGLDGGLRFQLPARVTPFAGIGVFAGGSETEETHGFTTITKRSSLFALYPEAGVTLWLNGHSNVSTFGRYYLTSGDRGDDFSMFGIGFTLLSGSDSSFESLPPSNPSSSTTATPYFVEEIISTPVEAPTEADALAPGGTVPSESNALPEDSAGSPF